MRFQVTLDVDLDVSRALVLADDGTTVDGLAGEVAGRLADHATDLGANRVRVVQIVDVVPGATVKMIDDPPLGRHGNRPTPPSEWIGRHSPDHRGGRS